MFTSSQKKTGGNSLITFDRMLSEFAMWQYMNLHYIIPTEMFIEGQYNWEREEFDEHG